MPASSSSAAIRSAAIEVAGQHARAEAELAVVGDADGVGLVLGRDDRGDRAEHLLVVRRLPGADVGQHGRRIPGAGRSGISPPSSSRAPRCDAVGHLVVDLVARLDALHRAELGRRRRADRPSR